MNKETLTLKAQDYQLGVIGLWKGWLQMSWSYPDGRPVPETLTPFVAVEDGLLHLEHEVPCQLDLGRLQRHPHHAIIWNTHTLRPLNQWAEANGHWNIERYLGPYLTIDGQKQSDPEVLLLVRLRDPQLIAHLTPLADSPTS
jgi:hypothetical protein